MRLFVPNKKQANVVKKIKKLKNVFIFAFY